MFVTELPDVVVKNVKSVVQRKRRSRESRISFELWENRIPCNLGITRV